jgi:hypothetical protein
MARLWHCFTGKSAPNFCSPFAEPCSMAQAADVFLTGNALVE